MAITYGKKPLVVIAPSDAWLGMVSQKLPEGATQTFVSSSPVVFASGYIVAGANPVTAVAAFSLEAAHNGATDGLYNILVVPALPDIHLRGNFLATAAADNVLEATDLGITARLALSSTLIGGATAGWYILDTQTTVAVKVVSFAGEDIDVPPNQSATGATAGDTNARVRCSVLSAVNTWLAA